MKRIFAVLLAIVMCSGMLSMLEEAMKTYDNVFFHGEYSAADRLNMAKNTDIIHNLYDKTDKTSHIAMGNKYYDGPLFSLPQLCTTDSYRYHPIFQPDNSDTYP